MTKAIYFCVIILYTPCVFILYNNNNIGFLLYLLYILYIKDRELCNLLYYTTLFCERFK